VPLKEGHSRCRPKQAGLPLGRRHLTMTRMGAKRPFGLFDDAGGRRVHSRASVKRRFADCSGQGVCQAWDAAGLANIAAGLASIPLTVFARGIVVTDWSREPFHPAMIWLDECVSELSSTGADEASMSNVSFVASSMRRKLKVPLIAMKEPSTWI
jgi:hypothetical protein